MQQQQHQHQPTYSDGSDGIGSPDDHEGSVNAVTTDPSDLFMAAAAAAAAAAG